MHVASERFPNGNNRSFTFDGLIMPSKGAAALLLFSLDRKRDDQRTAKGRRSFALKVSLISLRVRATKETVTFRFVVGTEWVPGLLLGLVSGLNFA
jgi:hypothetical protein